MLIDFHVHTIYSGDSNINIRDLARLILRNDRLNGVVISDHDTMQGYYKLIRCFPKNTGKIVAPAIELSLIDGHLIIFGVEEYPEIKSRTVQSAVDYARDHGYPIIIPHPFRITGLGDMAYKVPADAIEILNGSSSKRENMLAKKLTQTRGLTQVGGSDAHKIEDVGKILNYVPEGKNVTNLVKALRTRKIEVIYGFRKNSMNQFDIERNYMYDLAVYDRF